jgi:outer membrane protein assembly factor BamB
LLDEAGDTKLSSSIIDVSRVIGVTVDNHFLVATNTGVSAIDESGTTLWTQNLEVDDFASIGENGVAVVKGEFQITGLNVTTGAILWTLVPPHAGQCISSGTLALTSDGTVMALQCDGTLFAAAD